MSGAVTDDLRDLLTAREDEHVEFKEAKNGFEFDNAVKYCAAFANEGGGKLVLGVNDRRPHSVVGTQAFPDLERTKAGLVERLRLRIDIDEVRHTNGRVLIFRVPSRPIGMPVQYEGRYWMRAGESLVAMTPDMLKRIFEEAGPDFSAEVCPGASVEDLDPEAVSRFRAMWRRKSGNADLDRLSDEQLLRDAELLVDGGVTYAALILLGAERPLGRLLAQAETIFEYRSSEASIPFQQRIEYRKGFLLYLDALWETINLRNDVQHYQDGMFVWDISTFNEAAVREALLNAVSHRDYRHPGSVFVRQFSRRIEIVSPGGFPPGITLENVLRAQFPRNRRVAETLARCGLVERSGQGMDRMFKAAIEETKPRPDFTGTDGFQVSLILRGDVQDARFLRFLEQVGTDQVSRFTIQDLLVLDLVHREQRVSEDLRPRLPLLVSQGVLESSGRGRGTRYMLSRRFYDFVGERGAYTRRRGLDHETNKALLLKHIEQYRQGGSPLEDLRQVLPALSDGQIKVLVRSLRADGAIHSRGRTRAGRWFPGPAPDQVPAHVDGGPNRS